MSWVLGLVLLLASGAAPAADRGGDFAARGLGGATCQIFLDDRTGNPERFSYYLSWLNGYFSAYNLITPETYDITAGARSAEMLRRVEGICEANPGQRVWAAAAQLTAALRDQRLVAKPEEVNLTAGENTVTVTKAQVRRVQQALKDRGYQVGVVDGLYGGNTRRALEAYQQSESLPVTGLPDRATLARLLQ